MDAGQNGTLDRTLSKLRAGTPITIAAVGDSNSIVSMNTRGHMNWVSLLTEALWETYGDGLVTMVNVSKCGLSFHYLAYRRVQRLLFLISQS